MGKIGMNDKGMAFVEQVILAKGCKSADEAVPVICSELCEVYGMTDEGEDELKSMGLENTGDVRRYANEWFSMRKQLMDRKMSELVKAQPLKTNLKGMVFVEKTILSKGCKTVEEAVDG